MEALIAPRGVLELLDRNGRVEQRFVLNSGVVSIGRAYDNDLILDDVHVSPHHARISATEDGRWRLHDLGSVNGILVDAGGRRVSELAFASEQPFVLGLSHLRYRPVDMPVAEALPLRERRHAVRDFVLAMCAPLLCLAAFALDALLDSYEAFGALKVLNAVLPPFVGMLIWAGIWALVGRLLVQRLHFPGHLVVISIGLLFATLFETLMHLGAFALSLDRFLPWLDAAGICATFVLILYGHLRLASRLRPRRVLVAAIVFGTLLAGALQIKQLVYQQQFSTRPRFTLTLAPPSLRLVHADTTAAFYTRVPAKLTEALAEDPPAVTNSTATPSPSAADAKSP